MPAQCWMARVRSDPATAPAATSRMLCGRVVEEGRMGCINVRPNALWKLQNRNFLVTQTGSPSLKALLLFS